MIIERNQYRLVAECILSGQLSEHEISELMEHDPSFGEWFCARTSKRLSIGSPVPEEVDLISLAAWLHRKAKQAEGGAAAGLNEKDAARLAQASEIVKEAADRKRQEQTQPASRPAAANQA